MLSTQCAATYGSEKVGDPGQVQKTRSQSDLHSRTRSFLRAKPPSSPLKQEQAKKEAAPPAKKKMGWAGAIKKILVRKGA